ncbi:MAG: class I SAM-dependent methyltransferase [Bacteroidales bacterium]|nr:class I SAM-dependent methyltransferase [Bacteroidales bacterium]
MKKKLQKLTIKHISKAILRRWEKLTSIDFSTPITAESISLDTEYSNGYEPISGVFLKKVLCYLKINNQDTILDIGCGKGYALKIMLKFPFAKVDGVEISEMLAKIARNNFKKRKNKIPTIYTENAVDFNSYDDYNYFYFFNPFPSFVMLKVLEKLKNSIQKKPRKVIIIYANPTCHDDIINTNVFSKIVGFRYKTKSPIWIYSN